MSSQTQIKSQCYSKNNNKQKINGDEYDYRHNIKYS